MLTLKEICSNEKKERSIQKLATALGFSSEIYFYFEKYPEKAGNLNIIVSLDPAKKETTNLDYTGLLEAKLEEVLELPIIVLADERLTDPLKRTEVFKGRFKLEGQEEDILSYLSKQKLEDITFAPKSPPTLNFKRRLTVVNKLLSVSLTGSPKTAIAPSPQSIRPSFGDKKREREEDHPPHDFYKKPSVIGIGNPAIN